MNKLGLLPLMCGVSLFAQSAETLFFRATMLATNEVPAVQLNARGAALVVAHVVRDRTGQVVSGTVDFEVSYSFPGAVTITGLHVHPGVAGENGPVAIGSGVGPGATIADATGRAASPIQRSGQVLADNTAGVAALRGMIADPSRYYVNLHTSDHPAGVIRGQLERADVGVFLTLMSSANEVPPAGIAATGLGQVAVITSRDPAGKLTGALMTFDVTYSFPNQVTFTGFHIHGGRAGVNAPVLFNTGITGSPGVPSEASGAGSIRRAVEIPMDNADLVAALDRLLADPAGFYLNLHTTEFPGGAIRAQLRRADRMVFPAVMTPANEAPPIGGLEASGIGNVHVATLRHEDGSVAAGSVWFDVNYRFPAAVEFLGMHIHNGVAGENGPVTISSGLSAGAPEKSDTGFGNLFRYTLVTDAAGLATLNSLVRNPEDHYVNLHSTEHRGGVVRAQLAPVNRAAPVIDGVISANLLSTTLAPGSLVTIFGRNLAKVTTDISGWEGGTLPDLLNGVAVAVGGQRARLLFVSPLQVNALLAAETPAGTQPLAVNNGNTPSAPLNVTVAAVAPAVFGAVAKRSDGSLVSAANPARAGDVVLVYVTGLGTATPSATIGGQNAEVLSSELVFPGLRAVAIRVPSGVSGAVPLRVVAGGAASNAVTLSAGG